MTQPPDGHRCPTCGDWVAPGAAWRPFCSERCKGIDLGHWLAGRYKIPARDEEVDVTPSAPAPDRPEDDDDAR